MSIITLAKGGYLILFLENKQQKLLNTISGEVEPVEEITLDVFLEEYCFDHYEVEYDTIEEMKKLEQQ